MALVHGIDLGAWRVRVASVEGSFRRVVVRDVVEMEAAGGPAEALVAIEGQERSWANADHIAALPLDHAAVRLVKLPFTDRNTILKALPAEVESSVPYDLEDMVLATHFVDTTVSPSLSLAITAAKERVKARLDLLKAQKADPKLLPLDAHVLATYAESGNQVVLDVGHSRTVVVFAKDGEMRAARLVPSGGAALTAALQQAFGCTAHDAESYKHQVSLSAAAQHLQDEVTDTGDPTRQALRALFAALDEWSADLRATLIAIEDELGLGVDEVLLAGGGAQLQDLPARLQEQLGVPVRFVEVPGGQPVSAALAVGLGRIAHGEARIADLRLGEFAYKGHADLLWNVVFYGAAAAVAAVFAGGVMFALSVNDLYGRLREVDDRIAATVTTSFPEVSASQVEQPSMAVAIMQEKAGAAHARVEALGAIVGGKPPTLEMLRSLSLAVPPSGEARIDVRELTINEDAVSFKADTDTYESAAKIEESIKKNPSFAQAHRSDDKKAGEGLSFTMSIPLGEPPAEDAAPAAPAGEEG